MGFSLLYFLKTRSLAIVFLLHCLAWPPILHFGLSSLTHKRLFVYPDFWWLMIIINDIKTKACNHEKTSKNITLAVIAISISDINKQCNKRNRSAVYIDCIVCIRHGFQEQTKKLTPNQLRYYPYYEPYVKWDVIEISNTVNAMWEIHCLTFCDRHVTNLTVFT